MSRLLLPLTLLLTAPLVACGDGGGSDGTAPAISTLTLDPASVPQGQTTNVLARVEFTDPDGDIAEGHVAFAIGGQSQTIDPVAIQGAAGTVEGEAIILLQMRPPTAEPIEVDVWLVDAEGNDSNTLTATLTVTP